MSDQFRCAYFTSKYRETLEFYREGLGLAVSSSWDKGVDDRGTIFTAASGMIEVIARPSTPIANPAWDGREPAGITIVVEIADVDATHARAEDHGIEIIEGPKNQSWGHRSLVVADPSGVRLYLFSAQSP